MLSRQPQQAACREALAGAGFANQCDAFTGAQAEVNTAYHWCAAIGMAKTDVQPCNIDQRLAADGLSGAAHLCAHGWAVTHDLWVRRQQQGIAFQYGSHRVRPSKLRCKY